MTTSDNDARTAKERIEDATDALQDDPTNDSGRTHRADHVSVEIDEAKQHAVSTIDATLQSASTAVKSAHTTYQQNPKNTLAVTGAIAIGILALVALLRRL